LNAPKEIMRDERKFERIDVTAMIKEIFDSRN